MDITVIIKEYYEQLYTHKFDALYEMDQFLERQNVLKLRHREITNINRSLSIKEIESITNDLSKKSTSSEVNSIKHLRQKLYQLSKQH